MSLHEYVVRQLSTDSRTLTQSYWFELYDKFCTFMSIIGYLWAPIISLSVIVVYHFMHVAS